MGKEVGHRQGKEAQAWRFDSELSDREGNKQARTFNDWAHCVDKSHKSK